MGTRHELSRYVWPLNKEAHQRVAVFRAHLFSCALATFIILAPVWFAAHAAKLDGVQVPNTLQVDGKTLHLNGSGLRTYSILGIHIYVASLYLEHLSTNPEQIIRSPETKLLTVRFEHNVSADQARRAWRDGLDNNCEAPCHLDPDEIGRFLAMVPAMHAGDNYSLLFTQAGVTVTVSGKPIGTITQPQFAEAMLATFLGPKPASPRLKRELLRGHG
jgi:Chalcone isomerase-like